MLVLVRRDISISLAQLSLSDLGWQRLVEVFVSVDVAVRIDMAKHDILGLRKRILVVQDEDCEAIHVDPHHVVGKDLQPVVEVDHAELRHEDVLGAT